MKDILVSVCLITYKHEKYIQQAIESILTQNIKFSWEIIIADDCSPDGTREILLKYKEQHPDLIQLILQKKNVGPGDNYIALMSAAQGKYIAYLEGDDYWSDPNKLQRQIDFLESNPDYGMACTDSQFYLEKKNEIVVYSSIFPSDTDISLETLLLKNRIIALTAVFRTSLFRQVSGILQIADSKKWKMGDYPLWIEMAANSNIRYLNFRSGVYRVLQNSVTGRSSKGKEMNFEASVYDVQCFFVKKYMSQNLALINQIEAIHAAKMIKFHIKMMEGKSLSMVIKKIFRLKIGLQVMKELMNLVLNKLREREITAE